uniref:Protein kinase domain-containing protein n=1 Tax=Oryza rufipogon TaxID=4529 RepID=A0A0E0NA19_ORYRU
MESMSWASESIRRSERTAPRRSRSGNLEVRGDVATELVVPKIKNSKRCRAAAEGGRSPLRRLKLTSRTTMLPEDINSAGRLPDRELYDRLRRDRLVSSPSDGDAFPQQQSMPFCHDMAMPPSCDSSAMNRRRELFSCSTQAMAELLLVIIILSTVMISSSDAYYQSCRCLGDGKNNQTSCDQAIDDSIKGSGQLIFRRIQPPITSVAFNVSFIGSLAFILRPVPAGGEYSNNSDAYGSLVFSGNTYNKTTTIITHSDCCSTGDSSSNVFVKMGALKNVSTFGVNITISRKASNIQIVQGNNYTISVWIDYNRAAEAADRSISVFVAKAGETKPKEAIIVNKDDNISKGATLQGCIFSSMDLQRLHQISDMDVTFAYGQHVSHSPSRSLPTILASVLGPAGGAVIAAAVTWLYFNSSYRRWKKDFDQLAKSMQSLPGVPVKISFADIRKATNNFHDTMKLGSGAFGAVYRCKLQSLNLKEQPVEVAVKKFTRADTRSYQDFLAEVSIINRLRHKSIVPLIGWSYNKGEPLLIYEYMPNGSLDRHIFARTDQLHGGHHTTIRQWDTRYNIVRDIATGLHYVHHEYEPKVLHRDIKASNILLDSTFRARLGDFGLACTVAVGRSSVSCGVAGTFGYIAPDYAINLKATQQTDVYAFGVLVLEIVTGKKAMLNDAQFGHITDWVWHLHQRGRLLEAVDGVLGTVGHGEFDIEEARRLLLLGLACSNPNPSDRPTMVVAVQVIAKLAPAPDVPLEKPTVVCFPPLTLPVGSSSSECTDYYVTAKGSLQIKSSMPSRSASFPSPPPPPPRPPAAAAVWEGMPDLGGDGDEVEKAPTLSPAAVACARGWMRRRATATDCGNSERRARQGCPPLESGDDGRPPPGSSGGGRPSPDLGRIHRRRWEESSVRQATLQSSPPLPPPASSCPLPSSWSSSTSSPRGRRRPPMDVDSDLADKGKPTQMDLEDQASIHLQVSVIDRKVLPSEFHLFSDIFVCAIFGKLPIASSSADDHGGGCNPSEAGGCCPGGGSRLVDSIDHTWAEEAVDSMMGLLAASSLGGAFSWGVLLPAMRELPAKREGGAAASSGSLECCCFTSCRFVIPSWHIAEKIVEKLY